MLEAEPLTLVVKIYKCVHNVRYLSEQRVAELELEFATQCMGYLKPRTNQRYFVCTYFGKAEYSNKLKLNQYRFEEGCYAILYPDGTKVPLLHASNRL